MKIKYVFIAALLALSLTSCTDNANAERILKANGFTQIEMTGYSWIACSEDDTFSTGFKAVGPTGIKVEGAVCSGFLFKNSTIRFN